MLNFMKIQIYLLGAMYVMHDAGNLFRITWLFCRFHEFRPNFCRLTFNFFNTFSFQLLQLFQLAFKKSQI